MLCLGPAQIEMRSPMSQEALRKRFTDGSHLNCDRSIASSHNLLLQLSPSRIQPATLRISGIRAWAQPAPGAKLRERGRGSRSAPGAWSPWSPRSPPSRSRPWRGRVETTCVASDLARVQRTGRSLCSPACAGLLLRASAKSAKSAENVKCSAERLSGDSRLAPGEVASAKLCEAHAASSHPLPQVPSRKNTLLTEWVLPVGLGPLFFCVSSQLRARPLHVFGRSSDHK